MRAKEVEKVSFPQYNSKKEEGPSQDGDYTILTRPLFCKLESNDVIDAVASSEVHGVGAYAPWSRTCVASSPQLNFSPAFPGKNQRHLWFFENAYDDLRAVLHVES